MRISSYTIVLFELLRFVYGYNILVVFPMAAFSHFRLGSSLAGGLAEAGHDVTLVSPFEFKLEPKKGSLRSIVLTNAQKKEEKPFSFFDLAKYGIFPQILMMSFIGNDVTNATLEDPAMKELIHSDATFDVVIIEQFVNDGLKALACHFNAHSIAFSTMGATVWVNTIAGNPAPPSYIPDIFVDFGSSMTLWQRTKNSMVFLFHELNRHYLMYPQQNEVVKRHFPQCPSVQDLAHNVSLFLMNSHESLGQSVPLVPNMINIGGYHVPQTKKLPEDIRKILDDAEAGVIFFSMGSNLKPSEMKPETKQALIDVLGKLKETVLWKWDEENLAGKTDNIVTRKWFPQIDILAHPNVKLFITHGGILSTTETIHHGVPILALPVFGDQKLNAAKAADAGYGVSLHFEDLTRESFGSALNEVLENPKYYENAKRRAALLADRPMKPMESAVYWTEFVVKYGGAHHLRVAGVGMPWYRYFLVDVMVFVSIVAFVMATLLFVCVRRVCCRRSSKSKVKKN